MNKLNGDNTDVYNSLRGSAVRKDSGNSSIGGDNEDGKGSLKSQIIKESCSSDEKNVNIIEIKSTDDANDSASFNLVQHTDSNGITHIEIESGPVSLLNGGLMDPDFSSIISLSTPETNGLVTALGGLKGIKNNHSEGSSCPNSLISESPTLLEKDKRFRQRQPALLLRDEMAVFDYKHSRKPPHEEPRESRSRKERFLADNFKTRESSSYPSQFLSSSWNPPERPSRSRDPSRPRDTRDTRDLGIKTKHNKGPAPPPPPRRHPNDSSLLLVPTKSGQEPKKSYYPKESHIVRGNKVVRVDFPSVPVWNHRADPNNNARHYIHYTGGWSHEYHAPRIREPIVRSEVRRRSRSKSPARKQIANRYLDAVTTFNFSQKLRELSDAVFSSKRGSNNSNCNSNQLTHSLPPVSNMRSVNFDPESLRPVIKKGTKPCRAGSDSENRRVTFSAYATVQLMES